MENNPHSASLNRAEILEGLKRLAARLAAAGVTGELCLFGGTVMVLAFNARLSTRDVDAIFQPAALIREFAGQRQDILTLVRHLKITSSEEVLGIVTRFFPPDRIPAKTQFMVHEVIARLSSQESK